MTSLWFDVTNYIDEEMEWLIFFLKVGDQILDVNGFSFLDTTHSDAVRCLRSSKRLIMTVKDVGKIPHAMTSYDRTQWISGDDLSQRGSGKPTVEKLTNGYLRKQNIDFFIRSCVSYRCSTYIQPDFYGMHPACIFTSLLWDERTKTWKLYEIR